MAAGSLVPEHRLVLPLVEGCGRWIWLSDGAKAIGVLGLCWGALERFALHSDSGTGRWQLEAWRPRAPFGLKAEGDDFG